MQPRVHKAWRALGGAAALVLLTHCGGDPEPMAPGPEQPAAVEPPCQASGLREETLDVEPEADTYVEALQQEAFGGARKLVADSASERAAYLRFSLGGLRGPVKRAELRLFAIDPSTDGPELYPVDTGWEEGVVTSRQPPAVTGALAADVGPVADESWVTYDVTALVRGSGAYGFGLFTHSRDGVDFASREHPRPELRPRLAVTVEVTGSDCGGPPAP
jgi:hypothetical protein